MDLLRTIRPSSERPTDQDVGELLAALGAEARAHRFAVAPNPAVGAAILADGALVARGFHREWGRAHAEIAALSAAGASGVPPELWDTLVVTLEPCSSHGKTPPCTRAILEAGIRRVIVGALDPDPRHRGRGLDELRAAGVAVELVAEAAPLARVAPHFLAWNDADRRRRPRPWTIAKWAQTLTGQLSPPEHVGGGRWISGPSALAEVQRLRGRSDAILTGIRTVLADDPRLTVRPPGDLSRPPLRVVLDSELRIPLDARLLAPPGPDEAGGEVLVFTRAGAAPARHRALEAAGVGVQAVRTGDDGRLSLRDVQRVLWELGIRRMMLEAGPTLLDAYFQAELVDQVAVYSSSVSGGRGPSLAARLAPARLREVERLEIGNDALLNAFL